MTDRTTGLVAGAVTTALLVAACSSGAGPAATTGTAATSTTATTSTPSTPATPSTAPVVSPDTGAATQSLTPVPSRARTTLPPAAPSSTVTVGAGARTVLLNSRNLTVTGQGPGELSGPAVALTLQVTNGSSRPLDLDTVTVSASIGGQEASSSDAAPARPFSGRLAPGAKAQGVYVFVLPASGRRPLGVVVSLAPDLPVARFTVP